MASNDEKKDDVLSSRRSINTTRSYIDYGLQRPSYPVLDPDPEAFLAMKNSPHINPIFQTSRDSKRAIDDDGNEYVEIPIKNGQGVTLVYGDPEKIEQPGTLKLLDFIFATYTKTKGKLNPNNPTRIFLNLEEYLALNGLTTKPEKDRLRANVKQRLSILNKVSWEYREDGELHSFGHLINSGVKVRGGFEVELDERAARDIEVGFVWFPKALFKLDERNPALYRIGRRLAVHFGIGNQSRNSVDGKRIRIRTLIADKDSQALKNKAQRNSKRSFRDPLRNVLNILVEKGVVFDLYFTTESGHRLTESEVDALDQDRFLDLFIHYKVVGYPKALPKKDQGKKGKGRKKNDIEDE